MNEYLSTESTRGMDGIARRIERQIKQLAAAKSQENIWKMIDLLKECVQGGQTFFVPLLEGLEPMSMQISKLNLMPQTEIPSSLYRKVELEKGGMAYCAFTSMDELEKGQPTDYQSISAFDMLETAWQDDGCVGVILNPWGLSILLDKELLSLILEEETDEDGEPNDNGLLYIDHSEACDQSTEATVNVGVHPLEFNEPCSRAFLDSSQGKLEEACFDLPRPEPGEIVVSEAPGLASKKVFHAALPQAVDEKSLSALICSILALAAEMGIRSITLPAIGTEDAKLDDEIPFVIIVVAGWLNANPQTNLSVTIACRQKETYQDFCSYLFE